MKLPPITIRINQLLAGYAIGSNCEVLKVAGHHDKMPMAAEMIVRGLGRKDIAQCLGVSIATVDRWLANEEFRAMVDDARDRFGQNLMEKWERLASQHAEAGSKLRTIAMQRLQEIRQEQVKGQPLNFAELRALADTLQRAINIERESLSMHLMDANRAIQEVLRLGYTVSSGDEPVEVSAETVG